MFPDIERAKRAKEEAAFANQQATKNEEDQHHAQEQLILSEHERLLQGLSNQLGSHYLQHTYFEILSQLGKARGYTGKVEAEVTLVRPAIFAGPRGGQLEEHALQTNSDEVVRTIIDIFKRRDFTPEQVVCLEDILNSKNGRHDKRQKMLGIEKLYLWMINLSTPIDKDIRSSSDGDGINFSTTNEVEVPFKIQIGLSKVVIETQEYSFGGVSDQMIIQAITKIFNNDI